MDDDTYVDDSWLADELARLEQEENETFSKAIKVIEPQTMARTKFLPVWHTEFQPENNIYRTDPRIENETFRQLYRTLMNYVQAQHEPPAQEENPLEDQAERFKQRNRYRGGDV